MCVLELNNWEEKLEVMENKWKLREWKDIKVFIDNNLTRTEQVHWRFSIAGNK